MARRNSPENLMAGKSLSAVLAESRQLLWAVGGFSFLTNLLILTGPLFTMLVYDRVLGSNSWETLAALTVLMVLLYVVMAVLDHARGLILRRIGARFHGRLQTPTFTASLRQAQRSGDTGIDVPDCLETLRRAIGGSAATALLDIPWAPVFVLALAGFHPLLAVFSLSSVGITILLGLIQLWLSNGKSTDEVPAVLARNIMGNSGVISALGMSDPLIAKWSEKRWNEVLYVVSKEDKSGLCNTILKSSRFIAQSGTLALGALLVIHGELSPSEMIAASILSVRVLSPCEQLIAQAPQIFRARRAWKAVTELLALPNSDKGQYAAMGETSGYLQTTQILVVPPMARRAVLRLPPLKLMPGQSLAIFGPSGSGKSAAARVLSGEWPIAEGTINYSGVPLSEFRKTARIAGYLPQTTGFIPGSIAENISGFAQDVDTADITTAAQLTGAHEYILRLTHGYETNVDEAIRTLPQSRLRAIALARALFREPPILILDEPLDAPDESALSAFERLLKSMKLLGQVVILCSHRPSILINCDFALNIENGHARTLGPASDIFNLVQPPIVNVKRHAIPR